MPRRGGDLFHNRRRLEDDRVSVGMPFSLIEGIPSLENEVVPLKNGFPRFVVLKNGGEKVRVITVLAGSGYCDFVVLRGNGEIVQTSISECVAPEDYVEHMFGQQDTVRFDEETEDLI